MILRYRDGVLGQPADGDEKLEVEMKAIASKAVVNVPAAVEALQINRAVDEVMELVRATNRYLEMREPWQLAKDEQKKSLLDTTLYTAVESLRLAGVLLYPVMPEKTVRLMEQLGFYPDMTGGDYESLTAWGVLEPGSSIPGGESLFPRIELPEDLRD